MLSKISRRMAAPVALLSVGVLVAACSSSSGSSSSAASSAPAASESAASSEAAAPAGAPIRIGYAISQSGALASSVEAATPAANAWASWINENGGIAGRPVEIVFADTKGDAAATQTEVSNLVENEKVDALILSDAITESAIGEYLGKQNIAIIGAGGYAAPVWETIPNFFAIAPTAGIVVTSEVAASAANGAKTIGAAVCAEAATCESDAKAALEPTAAAFKMNYVGAVKVKATAPNYTAECLSFKEKGADVIALLVGADTGTRVMQDCVAQGVDVTFATSSTSFNPTKFASIAGVKMVGTLNGFPWWADAAPAQQFRDAMSTYAAGTDYASSSATLVWSSLELFKKVAGGISGEINRESVLAGYNTVSGETLDGLLPAPVTFTAGKPSPAIKCFWSWTWAAGDENPASIAPTGTSGNGATGDLATSCMG